MFQQYNGTTSMNSFLTVLCGDVLFSHRIIDLIGSCNFKRNKTVQYNLNCHVILVLRLKARFVSFLNINMQ